MRFFIAAALLLCMGSLTAQSSIPVGGAAPDFSGQLVGGGETVSLHEITAIGSHVALIFSFDNCSPCVSAVPALNDAYTQFGCGTGDVIFLNVVNGDLTDAENYQATTNQDYPVMASTAGVSAFGVAAFPTVVLVSPANTVLINDVWPIPDAAAIVDAFTAEGLSTASCSAEGCTDPLALNYNPGATIDDGSCIYGSVNTDYDVTDYQGNSFNLSEITASGKFLFIHFMADWNQFDELVAPEVISAYTEFGCNEHDVIFLAMNNSTNGDVSTAAWVIANNYPIPVVSQAGGSEAVRLGFGIQAFPSFVLVSPDNDLISDNIYGGFQGGTLSNIQAEFAANGIETWECGSAPGCMDPTACNYDPDALSDDGSCDFSCLGCTDINALNYSPNATIDDGSCLLVDCLDLTTIDWAQYPTGSVPAQSTWTAGDLMDVDVALNITDQFVDPSSGNVFDLISFTPESVSGTNEFFELQPVGGFGLPGAPGDQLCFELSGLAYPTGAYQVLISGTVSLLIFDNPVNIPAAFVHVVEISPVSGDLPGCTYPSATNFNPAANQEDGSCLFEGCTFSEAINFNPLATTDDGSCIFGADFCGLGTVWNAETGICEVDDSCIADVDGNGIVQTPDLLIVISNFLMTCDP